MSTRREWVAGLLASAAAVVAAGRSVSITPCRTIVRWGNSPRPVQIINLRSGARLESDGSWTAASKNTITFTVAHVQEASR